MPLLFTAIGLSDQGRVRSRNEDSFALRPAEGLIVVADGMGGQPEGARASALAIEVFLGVIDDECSHSDWGERMVCGVRRAHDALLAEGERDLALRGMGTTLTALHVDSGTGSGCLAHVGDSRAYLVRHGRIRRLSRDHTWVQRQVDQGLIAASAARDHPYAHLLTRCLGGSKPGVRPLIRRGQVHAGDLFLLCSDGVSKHLTDREVLGILRSTGDASDLGAHATALVEETNARGGTDNVTVVLMAVADE